MKETEIKLSFNDRQKVIARLKELGASFKENVEIIDSYYSNDSKSLNEAKTFIRIRKKGAFSELTFKGEIESSGDVWKRPEINSQINDPESMEKILEALKFSKILKNRTIRECWKFGDLEIVIVNIIEPAQVDYMEIEGEDEIKIQEFVNKLGDAVSPIPKDHFKKLDEAKNRS
jgi:predicted adenylyl cyclase CyaB